MGRYKLLKEFHLFHFRPSTTYLKEPRDAPQEHSVGYLTGMHDILQFKRLQQAALSAPLTAHNAPQQSAPWSGDNAVVSWSGEVGCYVSSGAQDKSGWGKTWTYICP